MRANGGRILENYEEREVNLLSSQYVQLDSFQLKYASKSDNGIARNLFEKKGNGEKLIIDSMHFPRDVIEKSQKYSFSYLDCPLETEARRTHYLAQLLYP